MIVQSGAYKIGENTFNCNHILKLDSDKTRTNMTFGKDNIKGINYFK